MSSRVVGAGREQVRARWIDVPAWWSAAGLGVMGAAVVVTGRVAAVVAVHVVAALAWGVLADALPRPLVGWGRGLQKESSGFVAVPRDGLWCVEVKNKGDRPAVLSSIAWETRRPRGDVVCYDDAADLIRDLAELGYDDEYDSLVVRLVPGFALAGRSAQRLLELPPDLARKFDVFVVVMEWDGPFGERVRVRAEVHPPHGLPTAKWHRARVA